MASEADNQIEVRLKVVFMECFCCCRKEGAKIRTQRHEQLAQRGEGGANTAGLEVGHVADGDTGLPGQFPHQQVSAQPERPELSPRFRVDGLTVLHAR